MLKTKMSIIPSIVTVLSMMLAAPAYADDAAASVDTGIMPGAIDTAQMALGEAPCSNPLIEELGGAYIPSSIMIEGESNPLYCVFNDSEKAADTIAVKAAGLIQATQEFGDLPALSSSNWNDYRSAYWQLVSADGQYGESNPEFIWLMAYFDIADNNDANNQLLAEYRGIADTQTMQRTSPDMEQLIMQLPYYAPAVTRINSGAISTLLVSDINSAVQYAFAHAEEGTFNPAYYTFSSDCTNFASQIRKAGGLAEREGFWKYGGRYGSTRTWYNADAFAKYFGIGFSSTSHRTFSQRVSRGDFIGLDYGRDGSCDHVGFVVNKGGDIGAYYNYQVAQHTSNYVDWTSSSRNKWETYNTATYLIIY